MAKLVQIIGVHHNPLLPRRLRRAEQHAGMVEARDRFEQMRAKMAEARPDALLVIASDHLNQFFMDNMPPFLVGKAPRSRGPFAYELDLYGMSAYDAPGEPALARSLIQAGFEHGLDLAFSDELTLDHAFVVPLGCIRPEADLPIVPFFTNVMAPPLPPPRRFLQVGEALRSMIDQLPRDARIGVLASGHLSVEIGGPKPMRGAFDAEFDTRVVELIGRGDVDRLLEYATWERMQQAGNFTTAVMNFLLLLGLARGRPASQADCVFTDTSTTPFLTWDLHKEAAT